MSTPSPPYMPPQPRDASMLKHLQGGRHPPTQHVPHPGVHTTPPGTLQHPTPPGGMHPSQPMLHHATPLSHHHHHHHTTPHSTLQSSSSNQSSAGGAAGPVLPHGKANGAPGARMGAGGPVLNISGMSSKHSVGGNSGSISPGTTGTGTRTTGLDQSRDNSHLTDLSHISRLTPLPPKPHLLHNHISHHSLHHPPHLINNSNTSSINSHANNTTINTSSNGHYNPSHRNGGLKNTGVTPPLGGGFIPRFCHTRRSSSSRGLLQTLGLLCLTSILLASLAFTFLLELIRNSSIKDSERVSAETNKTSDGGWRGMVSHDVTVALAAITLSLDLFCLLVCAAQFIFAVKLHKGSNGEERAAKYLRQSSVSRVCAVTGFFISVPLLLTGVIVHTFLVLHSMPATLTSAFIGTGIVLCVIFMIHNIIVWQKHKRNSMTQSNIQQTLSRDSGHHPNYCDPRNSSGRGGLGPHDRPSPGHHLHSTSSPLPPTTVDLSSSTNPQHELSTLV